MNKIVKPFVVGVLLSLPTLLMAQSLVVTTDVKGKMGYKDAASGEIKVKCIYDYAEPFDQNGLAKVGKSGKYGLMKTDGTFALPMEYSEIDDRVPGHLTRVHKGKTYGLINPQTLQPVLPLQYSYISRFNSHGLAWIVQGGSISGSNEKQASKGGKMGIINTEGTILVTPTYKTLCEFTDHMQWGKHKVFGQAILMDPIGHLLTDTLKTDCQYIGFSNDETTARNAGVMDIHGKILADMNIYTWVSLPVDGFMRYWQFAKSTTSYGYFVIATKTAHQCEQLKVASGTIKGVTHGDFVGELAPVNNANSWYFIDKSFNVKMKDFTSVNFVIGKDATDTYLVGIKNGGSVIFQADGKQILQGTAYDNIGLPEARSGKDRNFNVCKDNKWGLCDAEGKELIAPQYQFLTSSIYGLYYAQQENKWGAVDATGNVIIPTDYSYILYPKESDKENIWCGSVGDTVFVNYNIKKGPSKEKYVYVDLFDHGYASVTPLKPGTAREPLYPLKRVLIDTNNNIVVSEPFYWKRGDDVIQFMVEHNGKVTKSQQRQMVLKVNSGTERYNLTNKLPESEWDF